MAGYYTTTCVPPLSHAISHLHPHQAPNLVAFEYSHPATSHPVPQNTLLWLGGLGDTLQHPSYPTALSHAIPKSWSLARVLLSSAGSGWGITTLAQDATELAQCIAYFRNTRPAGKIAVMGHSTGCQDIMEYLVGHGSHERPKINGAILQAPVSDREGMVQAMTAQAYDAANAGAKVLVETEGARAILPFEHTASLFGSTPVSAQRWLSLASPEKNGDDDFFSSDLAEERLQRTFGSLPGDTAVCFIMGSQDEYVPDFVVPAALLRRWCRCIKNGNGLVDEEISGVVEGASHNYDGIDEHVLGRMFGLVRRFLEKIESGDT